MVDRDRRYVGGAFIALSREQREKLWSPVTEGKSKGGAERLQPGRRGRVRHLRAEKELRHATLEEFGKTAARPADKAKFGRFPA